MSHPEMPVFALDIGTRKVAGVIAEPHGKSLKVLAACLIEHSDRSMLDGQVHKIEAVAGVVARVKAELEAATGLKLTHASVAAAGRALLTESAKQTRRFPCMTEIGREEIMALELAAARFALASLGRKREELNLHCVGFSPVRFWLDGQELDDLNGHRGQEIAVEVLATFLPRQVVDSLLAVLRRADLAVSSLTLEPIAAIEATIPADLRRLNLALVDIGAGTSDIALTRSGAVFAYAMVTQAGDEITEKLCEHYLLEFHEGERIKRLLERAGKPAVEFTTLLNQRRSLPAAELLQAVAPHVRELAQAIAARILDLNGGPPKAVIMVGGGSATPGLGEMIAQAVGLDATCVGVRGPDTVADLINPTGVLVGIEGITPLGIALSALRGRGLEFQSVQVNGQRSQLLALHEQPTVFDALLASGRELKRLYPRPGMAVTYTLAGKVMALPGTPGQPAELSVNGIPAHMDTALPAEADIRLVEAVDGEDAVLRAENVPHPAAGPVWCTLNGRPRELNLVLMLHGRPVKGRETLPDRAELEWVSNRTLAELMPEWGQAADSELVFTARINGQLLRREQAPVQILANRQPVGPDYRPRPDDKIECSRPALAFRVKDLVGEFNPARKLSVLVNGKPRNLDYGGSRILVNGRPAGQEDPVPEGAEVVVEPQPGHTPIVSQVLEGISLASSKEGMLKLTVDGQSAGFTTPLRNGAKVEVTFG